MVRRVRCVGINDGRVKRQEGKDLAFLRYCKEMFYKHSSVAAEILTLLKRGEFRY